MPSKRRAERIWRVGVSLNWPTFAVRHTQKLFDQDYAKAVVEFELGVVPYFSAHAIAGSSGHVLHGLRSRILNREVNLPVSKCMKIGQRIKHAIVKIFDLIQAANESLSR